ncbi:MAG: hypothetical protein AAGA23_05215 [Pseudomonadota bacterium]
MKKSPARANNEAPGVSAPNPCRFLSRLSLTLGVLAFTNGHAQLTADGNTQLSQETGVVIGNAEPGGAFGQALATGDFDNDGRPDIAIGVPGKTFQGLNRVGRVQVIYGTDDGLTGNRNQVLEQANVAGMSEAGDRYGSVLVAGDFNGDGFSDLAVGVPDEAIGSLQAAGVVQVIYGSATGLDRTQNQFWAQDQPGIDGVPEAFDNFGSALAACDFDGDGGDDLAIGASGEGFGPEAASGIVQVLYSGISGLSASGTQLWEQGNLNLAGTREATDLFGYSLTCGDYDDDGWADLAIGAPLEDVGTISNAGSVNVIYGSASGLTTAGNQLWIQGQDGIVGTTEAGDQFGWALATGNFDGDRYDDLVVGANGEAIGSVVAAGAVHVVFGTSGGLNSFGDVLFEQGQPDIGGDAETSDQYGRTFTVGDFDGNGIDDLAVGVPFEDIGSQSNAGAVNVLYGGRAGINLVPDQLWFQDSPGILDVSTPDELFGVALAAGDFSGDGVDDLAIGVPGQNVGEVADAGWIQVINGSGDLFADGFEEDQ